MPRNLFYSKVDQQLVCERWQSVMRAIDATSVAGTWLRSRRVISTSGTSSVNPALAQFIVDDAFDPVEVTGPFDKRGLDLQYVAQQEEFVTRGWKRLHAVIESGDPIIEYPLPEVRGKLRSRYS